MSPVGTPPQPGEFARHWSIAPGITFLNHGSFGACPKRVQQAQQDWRDRMEGDPVQFFARDLECLLDDARTDLAAFLGCSPESLTFVPNATAGVNAVVRSLQFGPGDELLTTNHEYNACTNVLRYTARRAGADLVVADVPFPTRGPQEVIDAILGRVTPRTKLALIDHITSQTGVIFPIQQLVAELESRGVPVLVDGAHAPGMVDLKIHEIGAAFYTGNCHKWMCAPKGAAFLHVRADWQDRIEPASISHGLNSLRTDRSRFQLLFDWTGTDDPTPFLSVPVAIETLRQMVPGGWDEIRQRNHDLALRGRTILCDALGVDQLVPDSMIGSIATIPLPDSTDEPPTSALYADPLQDALKSEYGIQVPVIPWPQHPRRVLRISAQLYNSLEQYEHLAQSLKALLSHV